MKNCKIDDVVLINEGHYKGKLGFVYMIVNKQPIVQVEFGIKDYGTHTQEFELNIIDIKPKSLIKIGVL